MPSWSLSEPFCSTSWSMAVYLSSSPCHPACRLAAVIFHSPRHLAGLTHLNITVKFKVSKARLIFEELTYWFVKTRAIRSSTVVKAIPSCGGDPFLHRQVQKLHASTTSLISDFGCINFFLLSLVLSINSPNATSLHSRCIWEEVCGIMINVLVSRVWSVPYILYIALWVKLNTYSSVSFLLLLVTEAITLPPWNALSSPLEVDVLYRKAKKERESYSVCHSSSSETLSQSHQFPFYPWYPQTVRHPDHTRSKQQGISSRTTLTR